MLVYGIFSFYHAHTEDQQEQLQVLRLWHSHSAKAAQWNLDQTGKCEMGFCTLSITIIDTHHSACAKCGVQKKSPYDIAALN